MKRKDQSRNVVITLNFMCLDMSIRTIVAAFGHGAVFADDLFILMVLGFPMISKMPTAFNLSIYAQYRLIWKKTNKLQINSLKSICLRNLQALRTVRFFRTQTCGAKKLWHNRCHDSRLFWQV